MPALPRPPLQAWRVLLKGPTAPDPGGSPERSLPFSFFLCGCMHESLHTRVWGLIRGSAGTQKPKGTQRIEKANSLEPKAWGFCRVSEFPKVGVRYAPRTPPTEQAWNKCFLQKLTFDP